MFEVLKRFTWVNLRKSEILFNDIAVSFIDAIFWRKVESFCYHLSEIYPMISSNELNCLIYKMIYLINK